MFAAAGVAQFADGLGFDLANALSRYVELPADFLECARMAVEEPETQLKNAAFALSERVKHIIQLFL